MLLGLNTFSHHTWPKALRQANDGARNRGGVGERLSLAATVSANAGALLVFEGSPAFGDTLLTGKPALAASIALRATQRLHFRQQCFTLSRPATRRGFFRCCAVLLCREIDQFDVHGQMPDASTIQRFRHRLEKYKLAEQILATVNALFVGEGQLPTVGTAVDASLSAAPTFTKNKDGGDQRYFGTQTHLKKNSACKHAT